MSAEDNSIDPFYWCLTEVPVQKQKLHTNCISPYYAAAGPRSAVGSASDSRARGPGFDTLSGHKLSFLLPLIQEWQLSVTGESMCAKYC